MTEYKLCCMMQYELTSMMGFKLRLARILTTQIGLSCWSAYSAFFWNVLLGGSKPEETM